MGKDYPITPEMAAAVSDQKIRESLHAHREWVRKYRHEPLDAENMAMLKLSINSLMNEQIRREKENTQ